MAQRSQRGRNIFYGGLRQAVLHPLAPGGQVGVAFFRLGRQLGVERGIRLGQVRHVRAQIGERLDRLESRFFRDARIARPHLGPSPLFVGGIARGEIQNLVRPRGGIGVGRIGN